MASPPSKASKRQHVSRAIRCGYDQFKHALFPSSHLPPQDHESTACAGSASPAPSAISGQSTATVSPHGQDKTGKPAGLSTTNTSSALTAANAAPSIAEKLKKAGGAARSALRVLESSADSLPYLKSAISSLIDCLDIVEAAAKNSEDYEELTAELTTMAGILNEYLSELDSVDSGGSATRIALSIEAEVAYINKQQGRGKGRRMVESVQDKEDFIKRYHRIEGLFRQLQGDISLRTLRKLNEQHAATLLRGMSPIDDARYNSSYSMTIKRQGCTAETRQKVQADLRDWVQDPNSAKVYWMNGMAGTGKTTIAYSLCGWLEANQQLGASFFCSRVSSSCRNVNWIVPTLAYQLARYSPAFQSAVCKVLKDDPDASKLNVVRQFEKLVREPMLAVGDTIPDGVVVVVDALDECEDDYGVRLVLGTLLQLGANLPLKFFVTSRPESAIRDKMLSPIRYPPTVLHLHDIEQSIVEEDIKKYLAEALSSMSPPPCDKQIEQLAKRAGKLFIFAATAVRYILPGKGPANSIARLNTMLVTGPQANNKERPSKKYKELDELYKTILATAFNDEGLEEEEIDVIRLVLRTSICAKEPMTILTMASLLGLTEEQVSSALQPLRSVLHVTEADGLVSALHASFPDYMFDHIRSEGFYCDQAQHSEFLAHRCFDVMRKQLRFNICGLESSIILDKDVPGLEERAKACITPTLFYACQYWGEHLRLAGASDALGDKLADFLTHRLLFWMEVLNLRLCTAKGVAILLQAEKWLLATNASAGTHKQAIDAQDFVTRFAASACSHSTPHIYISALPFCAKSSSVREGNGNKSNSLVLSVAFSPDGSRIVSGSDDQTLQVWDTYTGTIVAGPFKGHSDAVRSVAFSNNNTHVASGSDDHTVRVWDTRTGNTITGPFEGHTDSVNSVAFSPDGVHIVSGSSDRTIRVWDAHTGIITAEPFRGHTGLVNSVVFSPDSTRIVSGSSDRTIRVWDARTGNPIARPFEGHIGWVRSVAFSPDNVHIVSGSYDRTIRVWNVCTGKTVAGPFKGHTDSVRSVAFSPDSARIVSASDDRSIRVWDVCAGGTTTGLIEGHTSLVNSAAFSLDGARIVSGSSDWTIRVWSAHISGTATSPSKEHTGSVNSVVFSPGGTCIISGSSDGTIRAWDALTGKTNAEPFKGHVGWVRSVAFSPDGAHIVSGSDDQTIQVWDICTGKLVAGPFKGHSDVVRSVAFSPNGNWIVSGSDDWTVRVWNTHTGKTDSPSLEVHTGSVNSVAFSPDGTRIISGSSDRTVRVWDALARTTVAGPFKGHEDPVRSVAFSPNGAHVVSGSDDRTIRVWHACAPHNTTPSDEIAADLFEQILLFPGKIGDTDTTSDSDDLPTRVRSARTRPFFRERPQRHTGSVERIPLFSGGFHVDPSSSDELRAFQARSERLATMLSESTHLASNPCDQLTQEQSEWLEPTVCELFEGHAGSVRSVAFSPDGAHIVSGSGDQTIRVWDTRTGAVVAGPFQGHTNSVNSVAFSSDGTRIVSGSYDQTIRVWNMHLGAAAAETHKAHASLVGSVASPLIGAYAVATPNGAPNVSPPDALVASMPNSTQQACIRDAFMGISDFKFNDDGWISTDNIPLFWVSPDFRAHVPHPRNALVIGPQGTVEVDYGQLKLGERWSECYISQ